MNQWKWKIKILIFQNLQIDEDDNGAQVGDRSSLTEDMNCEASDTAAEIGETNLRRSPDKVGVNISVKMEM